MQEKYELVCGYPRAALVWRGVFFERPRRQFQYLVALLETKAVVDRLKLIDIHVYESQGIIPGLLKHLLRIQTEFIKIEYPRNAVYV